MSLITGIDLGCIPVLNPRMRSSVHSQTVTKVAVNIPVRFYTSGLCKLLSLKCPNK